MERERGKRCQSRNDKGPMRASRIPGGGWSRRRERERRWQAARCCKAPPSGRRRRRPETALEGGCGMVVGSSGPSSQPELPGASRYYRGSSGLLSASAQRSVAASLPADRRHDNGDTLIALSESFAWDWETCRLSRRPGERQPAPTSANGRGLDSGPCAVWAGASIRQPGRRKWVMAPLFGPRAATRVADRHLASPRASALASGIDICGACQQRRATDEGRERDWEVLVRRVAESESRLGENPASYWPRGPPPTPSARDCVAGRFVRGNLTHHVSAMETLGLSAVSQRPPCLMLRLLSPSHWHSLLYGVLYLPTEPYCTVYSVACSFQGSPWHTFCCSPVSRGL